MIMIDVQNKSKILSDGMISGAIPTFQKQITDDFFPAWGINATLTFVPSNEQPHPDHWRLMVFDNSDQAGALGYHDLTPKGLPLGKIFAATVQEYDEQWSVTFSHEMLEMILDPFINLSTLAEIDGKIMLYAYEVADAVQDRSCAYHINDVLVSDFVYPAWYEQFRKPNSAKFDHMSKLTSPFQLFHGGYIGVYYIQSGKGWVQLTDQKAPEGVTEYRPGSRPERRLIPKNVWQTSTDGNVNQI